MAISESGALTGSQGISVETMLQNCVACGLLVFSAQGQLIVSTPEAERILGSTTRPGSTSVASLPSAIQDLIGEVQSSGRMISDRRVTFASRSRGEVETIASVLPIFTNDCLNHVVVSIKEFTLPDRVGRNLQNLDRLASAGVFSASMAHEIKNALVAVKTFVELLLEKNHDAELAGVVRREMGRIDIVSSDLLRFAAPVQPAFASVRLHNLLDHALRLIRHPMQERGILLVRQFNAPSDAFIGDDHQLEQAFVNLLLNAVESMEPAGTLTVSTESVTPNGAMELKDAGSCSGLFQIRISDTGAGISPENMDHIFEPFFTTKADGTGLGLAVTRRIIHDHRGTIHVESVPGKGTTFSLELPLESLNA
jgi:two-component system, NtrC family, sensor histidine kinase HydH